MEENPGHSRQSEGKQPLFIGLDLQIGKDHQRDGDGKAEKPDRKEEAEKPGEHGDRPAFRERAITTIPI